LTAGVDTWNAVRSKRMIRRFSGEPLEARDLDRILGAGRHAGSSKNLQRWDFIVCRERAHLRQLATLGPWTGHIAGAAVAIALVTPDPQAADAPLSVMFDLGQAAENMMLVAWELGIGSCPATVYQHDRARELLGFPSDHHCEFLLSFGYPADPSALTAPPKAGGRRPHAEIVHQERW
jgi:nitroreductase